ncbi:MAG: hypothetical protein ACLQBX_18540 [Candidatus Limnocylindrales bacterium]
MATEAIELTIHTVAGPMAIPLEAESARAILTRFGPPMRDGEPIDLAKEPPIETGRFLAAVWMNKIARSSPDDAFNVKLGDGSYVSIRPSAVLAVAARTVDARSRSIGFGAIEG